MSSNIPWQQVRGAHIDPSAIKFTNLQNKQNMFENELFKPPAAQLKIISADTHDRLAYKDDYFFGKVKYANSQYFMPFEPDGKYCILWCRFNHLARNIKDYSMAVNVEDYPNIPGNIIRPKGEPILCRGPDDGIKGGTIVSRINTRTNNDYFEVLNPESLNLGILAVDEGFSIFFRFMLEGDPVQHEGVDPTLWYHTDDPSGDYGTMLRVGTNRQLKFSVRDAGVTRDFISPNGVITSGLYHDACLTYRKTGNALTMTIDDVPMSDTGNDPPNFDGGDNSILWGMAQENFGADLKGRFVGRLADARWYKDLMFIRDHESNIWNNRRSICAAMGVDIPIAGGFVDLGAQTSLWSKSLTKFSYAIWFRPDTVYDIDYRNIISCGDTNDELSLVYVKSLGQLVASVTNDGYGTEADAVTDLADAINKWYFALVTYDKDLVSNNLKLILNGGLAGQANYINKTIAVAAAAKLQIGHYENDAPTAFCFDGNVRHFMWWNSALTVADGMNLYLGNNELVTTPNYWIKLNQGYDVPKDTIGNIAASFNGGAAWKLGSSHRPTEFGKLDVMGYSRFNSQTYTAGYDSVGFDSIGFDTS